MADRETREERDQREAQEVADHYRELREKIEKAAVDAREDEPQEQGFQSHEEYLEHVRQVPGIFGDTDTNDTASPQGADIPSANNEAATLAAAQADSRALLEDDEAAGSLSHAEKRRQVDVEADNVPSAQEANASFEARAEGDVNEEREAQDAGVESKEDEGKTQRAARKATGSAEEAKKEREADDDEEKAARSGRSRKAKNESKKDDDK